MRLKAFHTITVEAADGDNDSARKSTCKVEVTVNDKNDVKPTWVESEYASELSEATDVGSLVAVLKATDLDATSDNSRVMFAKAEPDADHWSIFKLDSDSGKVTTLDSLDYDEGDTEYELKFELFDKGEPSLKAYVPPPKIYPSARTRKIYLQHSGLPVIQTVWSDRA